MRDEAGAAAALFVVWLDRQIAAGAIPLHEVRALHEGATELLLKRQHWPGRMDDAEAARGVLDSWAHRWLTPLAPGAKRPPL